MKKVVGMTIIAVMVLANSFAQKSIYDFKVKDINGKEFDFATLKGKKIMIVNVASKCGFTKQYETLQKIYSEYSINNFVIVGFPANNFLSQEPGTEAEIANFCKTTYGVTFPMMSKIDVVGANMHPIYQWLTQKPLNNVMDSKVSWNFQKYLIDEKGKIVAMINPRVKPDSQNIINWIKGGDFKPE